MTGPRKDAGRLKRELLGHTSGFSHSTARESDLRRRQRSTLVAVDPEAVRYVEDPLRHGPRLAELLTQEMLAVVRAW